MNISIVDGVEAVEGLTDHVIIVDTFRASNTILSILEGKANEIWIPSTKNEAAILKKQNPQVIYFGEYDGDKLPEADYDNSPSQASKLNLEGKIAMLYTSRGTQALIKAKQAKEVLVASFGNASAITDYIIKNRLCEDPHQITFVSCGEAEGIRASEDYRCAQCILSLVGGISINYERIRDDIKNQSSGAGRLRAKGQVEDLNYCLQLNYSAIIPKVEKKGELVILKGV